MMKKALSFIALLAVIYSASCLAVTAHPYEPRKPPGPIHGDDPHGGGANGLPAKDSTKHDDDLPANRYRHYPKEDPDADDK
jgi:hypothetical protein